MKLPRRVCPATLAAGFALLVGLLAGLFVYAHLGEIVGAPDPEEDAVEPAAIVAPATPASPAPKPPKP